MNTKKTEQKSGFSTTSFILSLVGLLLALTVILSIIGVPMAITGLVFGIIALVQKQKKGLAIAGVIIGGIVTAITITIIIGGSIFLRNNADTIIKPITEMGQMMDEDPELAEMMNDSEVQAEFETLFKIRLAEKFGEEFGENEEFESRDDIKTKIPMIFEEMKSVMLELKTKHSVE